MEIDEAFARLVRRHWWVIVLCVVIPLVGVYQFTKGQPAQYTSTARVQADDTVPASDIEATGLVSKVDGIATSRDVLNRALKAAGVQRDMRKLDEDIKITGLGTSATVALAVTDTDPKVAHVLATHISNEVVTRINAENKSGVLKQLAPIEKKVKELNTRLTRLQTQLTGNPTNTVLSFQVANTQAELSGLQAQRNTLLQERDKPNIAQHIQRAALPDKPDTDVKVQLIALAGVLGLILGLLVSAVTEIASPSVPGERRVARLLGEPLLGRVRGRKADVADVGRKLRLAAKRAKVDTIVLAGVNGPVPAEVVVKVQEAAWGDDVPGLEVWESEDGKAKAGAARSLADVVGKGGDRAFLEAPADDVTSTQAIPIVSREDAQSGANGSAARGAARSTALARWSTGEAGGDEDVKTPAVVLKKGGEVSSGPFSAAPPRQQATAQRRLRVMALEELDPATEEARCGLVVVAPKSSKLARVRAVSDLMELSGWPLLGILGDRGRGLFRRR
ncbi:hypothetical protein [Bailinhaonella thermotolerans]|uniref:Polysaccharide chain length determinant N-terminal domain-containing protein n=1 Tax=Bailinhaonella thermotolerans TaxID=1070861 RepID=A0A3A4APB6_9ACTN|nr:hypothetical protein [Bailinhaonella thermotolerans]RJL30871.1 hypothetical protein D5H75_21450 [Bailinhaonella thermotolerans]